MAKVGLIQMTSGPDPEVNLNSIEAELNILQQQQVAWAIVPENALVFGCKSDYRKFAERLNNGPIQAQLAQLAKQYQMWLVVGSFPIQDGDEIKTTCLVFSACGSLHADYDKLHLFDVDVADAHHNYRESDTFLAGNRVVVAQTPFANIGLSICYDVRFPSLFNALRQQGAQVIVVPAAFTKPTGQAHWQVLLRARAIETQCWIVAVGQTGIHPCGRETWGHSMVVDPWGNIVASLSETAGHLIVNIDTKLNEDIRTRMPVMQHQRFDCQLITRSEKNTSTDPKN
ncbi:carbon-nitrogen hydrolase family protein [Vibrio sp. S11_S32]|uniref:carbon-nitrogen hydrolase family protein n=1 Tax=Vibrio sp. S11_S32 TaxID=2720225 RepID=UPI0016814644|nr:carbon-nitrogen hydrolase family protein [Vibrio sp. S11_S32]MBD1576176.1 carbon-nitrogen hydrolase family protein [Vibrio sp. S11_S32]